MANILEKYNITINDNRLNATDNTIGRLVAGIIGQFAVLGLFDCLRKIKKLPKGEILEISAFPNLYLEVSDETTKAIRIYEFEYDEETDDFLKITEGELPTKDLVLIIREFYQHLLKTDRIRFSKLISILEHGYDIAETLIDFCDPRPFVSASNYVFIFQLFLKYKIPKSSIEVVKSHVQSKLGISDESLNLGGYAKIYYIAYSGYEGDKIQVTKRKREMDESTKEFPYSEEGIKAFKDWTSKDIKEWYHKNMYTIYIGGKQQGIIEIPSLLEG